MKNWPGSFNMIHMGELNEEGLLLAGKILDAAKKAGWRNS